MIIGEKVEVEYRSLFSRVCPRPVKVRNVNEGETLFVTCLLEKWQPLIQGVLKELLVDPPKLNQLIKGRTGSRSFDQEKADTLLLTIETAVKKHLRKTDEGVQFYREGKNTAVKALTFCILGCQLIRMANEKWNLSNIKAKLINKTLVHYYLEGAAKISNAEMNDFEQFIVAREKKKEKKPDPVVRKKFVLEEEKSVSDSEPDIESPLLLSRDKLRKLSFFDVENYFLEGDEELTDALRKVCTNEEVKNKRCITCDESHEFYSLASRKLIHLFIYKNELFDSINLTADCLLEEQIDVTELRRRLELLLRQEVGQWELTQEEKNKFVLCTVCHLIRHFRLLGQLDELDGIQSLFKFKGEIYNLSEVEMESDRAQVMNELQLGEPQVIGEAQPADVVVTQLPRQEKMSGFKGLNDTKLAELKTQLEMIAKRLDMASLTPIEIIEYKRKAKKLLNPKGGEETFPPNYSWIDVFLANSHDKELQPFLAKEALIRLEKEELKTKKKVEQQIIPQNNIDFENLNDESIEQYYELIEQCDTCNYSQSECKDRKSGIRKTMFKNPKKLSAYWINNPKLQTCMAKVLVEKYEIGDI
ncbi:MAG: hypothetical protein ACTSO7_14570 [Candidatus Heimdallarchaeota archaeon]